MSRQNVHALIPMAVIGVTISLLTPAASEPVKPFTAANSASSLAVNADFFPREEAIYFAKDAPNQAFAPDIVVDAASQQRAGFSITVVGHTEPYANRKFALDLSRERALSVVAALIKAGVPASTLNVSWVGDTDPALPQAEQNGQGGTLDDRVTLTFYAR